MNAKTNVWLAAVLAWMICGSASAETYRFGQWDVKSDSLAVNGVLNRWPASLGLGGADLAQSIQTAVLDKTGLMSLETRVSEHSHELEVRELSVQVDSSSAYVDILRPLAGRPLFVNDLAPVTRLLQAAAQLNSELVELELTNATEPGGPMLLKVHTKVSTDPACRGLVGVSSFGQMYSASGVASVSEACSIGNRTRLTAAASVGLPGASNASSGGSYRSVHLGVDHVFSQAVGSLRVSSTSYRLGGAWSGFGFTGQVNRVESQVESPLSSSMSVSGGLGGLRESSELASLGLHTSRSSLYGFASLNYRVEGRLLSARWTQGHTGPALGWPVGQGGGGFSVLGLDGRLQHPLGDGWGLEISGSAQHCSSATPGSMFFYAGGPDRARWYPVGNVSGPSGVAAAVTLSKDVGAGRSVYVGVDAARVWPGVSPSVTQSSVFAGMRAKLSGSVDLDMGVSMPASGCQSGCGPKASLVLGVHF